MAGLDIGLGLAIATGLISALGWFRSLTRNQYARERELGHINRNLEQHSTFFAQLAKDIDAIGDRLSRLEILSLRKKHDD